MKKDELHQVLLATGMFEDMNYLNKYENLILDNQDTKYVVHITQCHHIIPCSYYKHKNIEIDNSRNNKVNLLYKDHVLAHYYLFLACKNNIDKYSNRCAIDNIFGHINFPESEKCILDMLPDIQIYYEETRKVLSEYNAMKNKKIKDKHPAIMKSSDVRNRISTTMKRTRADENSVTIHKGKEGRRVSKEDLKFYINNGWEIGSKQKGMVYVHKDGIQHKIWADELDLYLSEGWLKGSLPITTKRTRGKDNPNSKHFTQKFKQGQSERLMKYFETHLEARRHLSYPVRVYNDSGTEVIFESVFEFEEAAGIPKQNIGMGATSNFIKNNRVSRKGQFHNWHIEKYIKKEGDKIDN